MGKGDSAPTGVRSGPYCPSSPSGASFFLLSLLSVRVMWQQMGLMVRTGMAGMPLHPVLGALLVKSPATVDPKVRGRMPHQQRESILHCCGSSEHGSL